MKERTEAHTGLLRVTLAVDESRAYFGAVTPGETADPTAVFEQSWFGLKSQDRVRLLLASFRRRFDAFPDALRVLHAWHTLDLPTARLVCHWHTQLSDPIYRDFAVWLQGRRLSGMQTVRRHEALAFIRERHPGRWATNTEISWATKLLATAFEAGLLATKRDPRQLACPHVPDDALTYLLYLLREVQLAGSLADNPYLASVGLTGGVLAERVRRLPGVQINRLGELVELSTTLPSLAALSQEVA